MPTPKYPDDSIPFLVAEWWRTDEDRGLGRGRLVRAFVPHVDQVPLELIPEGRDEPTDHTTARVRIAPLNVRRPASLPRLPVAALPQFPGERRVAYRGKIRPALVLSTGGSDVPSALRVGGAPWQTSPTVLVAPYYGVERTEKRAGWNPAFVDRIRRAEYPQYAWDVLPVGDVRESILRLDHLQPVGRHQNAFEWTAHRLSDEALAIIDEWLGWLLRGDLPDDGVLAFLRRELRPAT
ncbi:MAG: hypothetical protein QME96_17870 [Myxococcota bacterium]|nr:hypothetical protein [Myxococcota bacterium]